MKMCKDCKENYNWPNCENCFKEPIPCCFSEVNELGKHITNCTNLPTKLDKDNVQIRYFCEEHMIKVENIRRKMAQKYINEYKEKLSKWMRWAMEEQRLNRECELLYKIENGEFDNE
ncbi:hypothetical protein [Spiroplasma endosymbiont of Dasysyrphus albostriatus]|uniref:hypothetical protein n=1 Tax=Spiroplasma endosymbiont of Dasysyrphus albostriatus TaxID=3066299 RepID=UPI0030CED0E2